MIEKDLESELAASSDVTSPSHSTVQKLPQRYYAALGAELIFYSAASVSAIHSMTKLFQEQYGKGIAALLAATALCYLGHEFGKVRFINRLSVPRERDIRKGLRKLHFSSEFIEQAVRRYAVDYKRD